MNIETTLVRARHTPFCKHYGASGVTPYPLVSKLDSEVIQTALSNEGLKERAALIAKKAKAGWAMLKGGLNKDLVNESRKGQASRKPTNTIVFDVDRLSLPNFELPNDRKLTKDDLRNAAERFVATLPSEFQRASYLAHASSSFGLKQKTVSLHIEFYTQEKVAAKTLKGYLQKLNLEKEPYCSQTELTASGTALRYPIDICLADNSRIIFIAPPTFDNDNDDPFSSNNDRFLFVEKDKCAIPTSFLDEFDANEVKKKAKTRISRLRKIQGLPPRQEKLKTVNFNGKKEHVVVNPDELEMEFYGDFGSYVTYNINGGDSHGYYVRKDNPYVVWNFKGEPPILFEKANEEVWQEHMEHFGTGDPNNESVIPMAFRSLSGGSHWSILYNSAKKRIERVDMLQKGDIPDFMAYHGGFAPEILPQWELKFDPKSPLSLDIANGIVNMYTPNEYLEKEYGTLGAETPTKDNAAVLLEKECPTIWKILYSVCGGAEKEIGLFLNWVAFIFKEKEKAGTAWVFQGTQGTGKGVMFNMVLKPLFGRYAIMKQSDYLEEQFNDWRENMLLIAIDEVKFKAGKTGEKMMNRIKNMVTETAGTVRKMRENQRDTEFFDSFLFFTNNHDAIPLDISDRRFNICPRQEIRITERFPGITDELHVIEAELNTFASLLFNMEVDVKAVKTPLDNAAKGIMREAARTASEDFLEAIRLGILEEFLVITDMPISQRLGTLDSQQLVEEWVKDTIARRESAILITELVTVYETLVGKISGTKGLTRILNMYGLKCGRVTKNGKRGTGIKVEWKYDDIGYLRNTFEQPPNHLKAVKGE